MKMYRCIAQDVRRYIIDPYIGLDDILKDLEVVKNDPDNLGYVQYKHHEICMYVVELHGYALRGVPYDAQTPEMCMYAIDHVYGDDYYDEPGILYFVNPELQTYEMCMQAIYNNVRNLEFVKEDLISEEMCMYAVDEVGSMIQFVPPNLITEEMKELAVRDLMAFKHIDDPTPELCIKGLQHDGDAIEYILEYHYEIVTDACFMAAVKQNGRSIRLIPYMYHTPELCLEAVKQDGFAYNWVYKGMRTKEMYRLRDKNYDYEYVM